MLIVGVRHVMAGRVNASIAWKNVSISADPRLHRSSCDSGCSSVRLATEAAPVASAQRSCRALAEMSRDRTCSLLISTAVLVSCQPTPQSAERREKRRREGAQVSARGRPGLESRHRPATGNTTGGTDSGQNVPIATSPPRTSGPRILSASTAQRRSLQPRRSWRSKQAHAGRSPPSGTAGAPARGPCRRPQGRCGVGRTPRRASG